MNLSLDIKFNEKYSFDDILNILISKAIDAGCSVSHTISYGESTFTLHENLDSIVKLLTYNLLEIVDTESEQYIRIDSENDIIHFHKADDIGDSIDHTYIDIYVVNNDDIDSIINNPELKNRIKNIIKYKSF